MGSHAVDLTQAPQQLTELVEETTRSGEVVLTRGGEAVAKIIPLLRARTSRRPGSARGQVHMAEDFAATPEELQDFF